MTTIQKKQILSQINTLNLNDLIIFNNILEEFNSNAKTFEELSLISIDDKN